MITKHLNQHDLARRWTVSERTLERWRFTGDGPQFIKLGGRVVYRLEDIEAFELRHLRQVTPGIPRGVEELRIPVNSRFIRSAGEHCK